jgi:hypothetical protein
MKPIKLIAIWIVLLASAAWGVDRPLPLDPNSVPFAYDPNLNYDLLAWRQGVVDVPLSFDFRVGFPGTDPNDPNTFMTVTTNAGTLIRDPNRVVIGGDVVDRYRLEHVRSVAIVEYIDITVTAPNGQSDSRTILFNFVPPPSPVIFVKVASLSKQWQEMWNRQGGMPRLETP